MPNATRKLKEGDSNISYGLKGDIHIVGNKVSIPEQKLEAGERGNTTAEILEFAGDSTLYSPSVRFSADSKGKVIADGQEVKHHRVINPVLLPIK